ncbi:hypothetical protein PFICI_05972 [Pestalotiopsis fici W106-1]|uniref:DNA-directed RNA polymerase subunit n=1 Tax=Pestalotiopsis fici (strain W106-1 / CGMCC3.15140) TaxID=1229662 RepID=W3X4I0_PESFW|nr:uncharacterized protein PFICI_05972 [Pestalotiopsis fici W106-1]ETS80970.1 hypothetical protein PFICI_05972 [Pestalotiopsis fici W106-1]
MSSDKKEKRSKRDKSDHKSKKRNRDLEAQPEEEHRHKRSKSEAPGADDQETPAKANVEQTATEDAPVQSGKARRSEKRKKKRQSQGAEDGETAAGDVSMTDAMDQDNVPAADAVQDEKKHKKEKRRKNKEAEATEETQDATNSTSHQPFGKLPEQPYPFFTQKVSQYLPLYPLGMIEPVEGYAEQHLKPLMNHYVPTFQGVLLGYHDVQVGEAPGKGSLTEDSDDTQEALLESIDEYAVSFGWLTAKLDLFKPTRGAWMEGTVNMQTEGHLGVVCWNMFNASIEAGRLPKGWRWVSLLDGKQGSEEFTPEDEDGQLHTTGYWVDKEGQRVRDKIRFQIKNFEVGVSGDYGYLSIEGTMLDPEAEQQKVADELEKLRRWKLKNGASRKEHKKLPDFSMTKFGMDEEQEDETQRAEVWKGSRPASETAE